MEDRLRHEEKLFVDIKTDFFNFLFLTADYADFFSGEPRTYLHCGSKCKDG